MAPGAPGAAVPAGAATRALRRSAFRLRIFSSVLSVRHPWQAALANASTGICLLPLATEHRVKSVVTLQNCDVTSLGCADASRERESFPLPPRSGGGGRRTLRSQEGGGGGGGGGEGPPPHPPPPPRPRGGRGGRRRATRG